MKKRKRKKEAIPRQPAANHAAGRGAAGRGHYTGGDNWRVDADAEDVSGDAPRGAIVLRLCVCVCVCVNIHPHGEKRPRDTWRSLLSDIEAFWFWSKHEIGKSWSPPPSQTPTPSQVGLWTSMAAASQHAIFPPHDAVYDHKDTNKDTNLFTGLSVHFSSSSHTPSLF